MIEYFAPYLSKPFRDNYASYVKELTGEDVTRFQFCLEDTKSKSVMSRLQNTLLQSVILDSSLSLKLCICKIKSTLRGKKTVENWSAPSRKN
jgi:hypothetical protein